METRGKGILDEETTACAEAQRGNKGAGLVSRNLQPTAVFAAWWRLREGAAG